MWALLIVAGDPGIEVGLQLLDAGVDALAEGDLVELVQQRFVKALADPVGLRTAGLCAAVIDVLDGEVELVFVGLRGAAVLGAPIGQHAGQLDPALVEERHHPIIEQVGRGDRGLAVVELGERHLGVGIDDRSADRSARHPSACRHRRCPAPRSSPGTRSRTRRAPRCPAGPAPGRPPGLRSARGRPGRFWPRAP